MTRPLRVLVTTDSFPPHCGGSGWSTWELVRGLTDRGHRVQVLRIATDRPSGLSTETYEGCEVTVVGLNAPRWPFVRNLAKNEYLWSRLARTLVRRTRGTGVDVLHAQHVMSTVPTIRAARALGLPVVATVRDYWPVCYWSDLIYDPRQPALCPRCTPVMMTRCVRPRAGAAAPAAWPLIPYMRANLKTKRETLARANAIIAVSSVIARDLSRRAPELGGTPLYTIPNAIDMAALDRAGATDRPMPEPYVLYAGKLATNKGVQYLLPALVRARVGWPLVVIGDGPLRGSLEAEARALRLDVRLLGWRDRTDVWTWMRHAAVLAFPSYGPESLSRVLIEAAALGAPIAAMDTGGTRDILTADTTGLLSADPEGFAADLARLTGDESLRARLGRAARADVRARFSTTTVVERVEQVYRQLLTPVAV